MGLFDKLFGGSKESPGAQPPPPSQPPPPPLAIDVTRHPVTGETPADYGRRIVLSEAAQNETLPEVAVSEVLAGSIGDEVPDGEGEFGRSPTNPVPVNGYWGEKIYLSLLRLPDGQRLLSHRLGAVGNAVDVFECMTADGSHRDTLFLDLYHPRRSRRAPDGYQLTEPEWPMLFSSTTSTLRCFPADLADDVRDWTANKFGIPLRAQEVVDAVERARTGMRFRGATDWPAARDAVADLANRLARLIDEEMGLPMRFGFVIPLLAITLFRYSPALTLHTHFEVPQDGFAADPFREELRVMMADEFTGGSVSQDQAEQMIDDHFRMYHAYMEPARRRGDTAERMVVFAIYACAGVMLRDEFDAAELAEAHRDKMDAAAAELAHIMRVSVGILDDGE
jgi:hypothetical protein